MERFYAGRARVDITPTKLPIVVNGQFEERWFDEIGDPLSVRAVVFRQGTLRVALAVVDTCMMDEALLDEAKRIITEKTGIPSDRVMISSTHCHSAPSVFADLGSGIDEEYAEALPGKIAEAVSLAAENMSEVEAGCGRGEDPTNVFCRRFIMKPGTAWTVNRQFTGSPGDIAQMNPFGKEDQIVCPTDRPDPTVRILAFRGTDGKPFAVFGNYSTHYAEEKALSADYFGVFCETVAKNLGAPDDFLAIMSNGTSGDCNSIDFMGNPNRKFGKISVGTSVARVGAEAYNAIAFEKNPTLKMMEQRLTLAVRKPTPEQVTLARRHLAEQGIETAKQLKDYDDAYAWETLGTDALDPNRSVKIQTIRVGATAIVALPMEVFTATGREIRFMSPFSNTIVVSLANGYNGYMPTADSFRLGGYTTWRARTSCLEEEAERKVRRLVYGMLDELAKDA